jgi:hypothetical protein
LTPPTFTVHAEKSNSGASETIDATKLSTASFGEIQLLPAPIGTSSSRRTNTVSGQTNSSVTFTFDTQAQVGVPSFIYVAV